MKKNNANIKNRMGLKLALLLLPFILGIIGFKLERSRYSYLDAAYASMQMYFANIPIDWEYNIYIEIGRWLAPICAVFLGIGLVMDLDRDRFVNCNKYVLLFGSDRKKETQKETPEYRYFGWNELNSYLRWDNVSSANYDDIRILLREKGVPEDEKEKDRNLI